MSSSSRPVAPSAPRVVIVDADRRVQDSLADLLGVSGDVIVVGCAGDVRSALEMVEHTRPDVVLIDPRLPDIEAGGALIGGMTRAWPQLRVVQTGWGDAEGHAIPASSPTRFVSKGGAPEEFISALVEACGPA